MRRHVTDLRSGQVRRVIILTGSPGKRSRPWENDRKEAGFPYSPSSTVPGPAEEGEWTGVATFRMEREPV